MPLSKLEKSILLLDSGFQPTQCVYLADVFLRLAAQYFSRVIRSLSVRIGRSTNLIGIADPVGVLQPGEIQLSFSQTFHDATTQASWPYLSDMDVLVARHPALRRSDVQKVRAVHRPELRHLNDVVIFPSKGPFPLAGKLQGGDYDGDTFWVCWEPRLTRSFRNAPAPTTSADPKRFGIEVDRRALSSVSHGPEDIDIFLKESFAFRCKPAMLGVVTNGHENLSYFENTIASPGVDALADLHDLLIDSAKNGYIYDKTTYQNFLRDNPNIRKKFPPKPAYRQALEPDKEERGLRTSPTKNAHARSIRFKKDHVVDYMFAHVIGPHIAGTLDLLTQALETKTSKDDDLTGP